MSHRAAHLAVVAAALALSACEVAAMGPQSSERITETRRLDPGGTFSIENTNGGIVVEAWDQGEVSIEAEKEAPEEALADLRVEIVGEGNRVEVRTHYPRRSWGFGRGAQVKYHVRVPEGAQVDVETTNGTVRVTGTAGALRAETTNGSVHVLDAQGAVNASTTNGSIQATFRRAPRTGTHRFETTNGAVSVVLPGDAGGEFEARTVNGGISTDFPLQVTRRPGSRRLSGRLGSASARFEIETVNGSVSIRRSGPS